MLSPEETASCPTPKSASLMSLCDGIGSPVKISLAGTEEALNFILITTSLPILYVLLDVMVIPSVGETLIKDGEEIAFIASGKLAEN